MTVLALGGLTEIRKQLSNTLDPDEFAGQGRQVDMPCGYRSGELSPSFCSIVNRLS